MDRIKIMGYKSIRELDLVLNPVNILIGANGSGKSNFLSFFSFLKEIYYQNLQGLVATKGIDSFLYKGDKTTQEISTFLDFGANGYSFTLKKGDKGFIFTEEGMWFWNNPSASSSVQIASYGPESALRFQTMPRADYIRQYLDQLMKYHFHDTGESSPFYRESNIENDKYYLYETGANLGAYLYSIQQVSQIAYNLIIKTIQGIAPYFLDFFLRPEIDGRLKLKWRSKHSSTVYGANDLSDGTLRFIALAVLFLQPELPDTIIIDEPELGLHPSAITKLAGLIKSAASKKCQIIIATQSTDLISHFEPHDVITVDQVNGESVFERLNDEQLKVWLEDYTIDELWKRNIITTGHPNF